ncbi:MAG: DUF3810 domain-containing protein [Dysgonamonadaceae bacterium]|nr:DUF3810 domain-containing protein [Dysgonamonadaceae bacterium]
MRLLLFALPLLMVIFFMRKIPRFAEWYMENVYPFLATTLSTFSNFFSFSLSDVCYLLFAIAATVLLVLMIIRKIKFLKGLYIILCSLTLIIAVFYFLWGFAYFRQDFCTRAGIRQTEYDTEVFAVFAENFRDKLNRVYVKIDTIDKVEIDKHIELQYEKQKDFLKIPYPNGKRKAKQMLFENFFSSMGVVGYFGLFNEIHLNNYALNFQYPFSLAHEKAHQFGIASEAEANLFAFFVCAVNDDESIRYSAYFSLFPFICNDYQKFFPDKYEEFIEHLDKRVLADLLTASDHWAAVRNKILNNTQNAIYDAYLKTNKISSGKANYSEVISLLIAFQCKNCCTFTL